VALTAIVLNREGILAFVVAGTAGFAFFHITHSGFECAGFVWEYFCMAISALVCLRMEVVTEYGFTCRCIEGYLVGFHAFVALVAISA
jgi:hypothetical protein